MPGTCTCRVVLNVAVHDVLPTVFGAFVRHHLLWMVRDPLALSFELGHIIPDPEESVQSSSAPVVGKRDLTFDIERVFGFVQDMVNESCKFVPLQKAAAYVESQQHHYVTLRLRCDSYTGVTPMPRF